MSLPIYLDYAATTPVDPRVVLAIEACLTNPAQIGNAHAEHAYGLKAREIIEEARANVAALIRASIDEIIWTSGATESINLSLAGAATLYQKRGKHVITWAIEHKAVLESCQQLVQKGFSLTVLPPQANGLIDL